MGSGNRYIYTKTSNTNFSKWKTKYVVCGTYGLFVALDNNNSTILLNNMTLGYF